MLSGPLHSPDGPLSVRARALLQRWPFVSLFVLGVLCNGAGSVFNFVYNKLLIVDTLTPEQKDAFWNQVAPAYNFLAYPLCLGLMVWIMWPLSRCLKALQTGQSIRPAQLERCRRRLVNLPFYQVCINFLGWMPGAFFFPLGIQLLAEGDNMGPIWGHFAVSFFISALMSTVQTFFLVETFLIEIVYPKFFQDARPAEVLGMLRIPLSFRLLLYWIATAVVPVISLLAILLSFTKGHPHFDRLGYLSIGTALGGVLCSALIAWLVGRSLVTWVHAHSRATVEITLDNFDHRIEQKRPDELGQLTDRFNDMVWALSRARDMRETFGELVEPEVRDSILDYYQGLGGEVQEITVLFADIRGFTQRSAGETPNQIFDLLTRFFSQAVLAVRQEGGVINKFLGDGFLALFGTPRKQADHADRAVRSALNLLVRLAELNQELVAEGQEPLTVGVGIHTGPALVGCVGALLPEANGRQRFRREFTAIGETVNLGQRVEQLTKTVGGPILLSEQTRIMLRKHVPVRCLGVHQLAGYDGSLMVHRVEEGPSV